MTVAIGLVCKDGVIVASDSMASTNTGTAVESKKVQAFENNPVVWTGAGAVYVKEEVEIELSKKLDSQPNADLAAPNLNLLRAKFKSAVLPAVKKCYESVLSTTPFPPGHTAGNLVSDFLFLGYSNDVPWFLEIDQQGSVNWHTEPGFYAVGSGGHFATVCHALMRHYIVEELTLQQGLQLAYRAIETTCEVSSGLVGLPVQIALVDSSGARILEKDEVEKIGTAVARWKVLERETLGFGSDDEPDEVAPADPLPTVEES